jgi:hypothetical protein
LLPVGYQLIQIIVQLVQPVGRWDQLQLLSRRAELAVRANGCGDQSRLIQRGTALQAIE